MDEHSDETWPLGIPDLPDHNITMVHSFGPNPQPPFDRHGCPPNCPRRLFREEWARQRGGQS